MSKLQNKRVLLTGATGGIGRAVLSKLLDAGAEVLITGRDASALSELLAIAPGKIRTFAADLTDPAACQELYDYCAALGGIDVLINNAGISQFSALQQQDYASLIQTNLLAPMQLTQLMLPLIKARKGSILLVGSTFGSIGYAGFTGYCASKFGLRGFAEALKRELYDSEVKVLYFAPRATKTAINSAQVDAMNHAMGQGVDSPEHVAMAMLRQLEQGTARCYLGSAENLFVRLNAQFPALVDKALGSKLKQIKQFFTAAKA